MAKSKKNAKTPSSNAGAPKGKAAMAKSKKNAKTPSSNAGAPKGKAAAPSPALPLFERPEDGVVAIRVKPAGSNRLAGFREAFEEAQSHYDKGSTANGKARERVKAIAKETGLSTKSIAGLRTILRMDPKDAVAYLNDVTLLAAEFGIFDAAEEADQAEANEANAASVDAAERDAPVPAAARIDGAPPKGACEAVFYQGQEAFMAGAAIDECPTDFKPEQAAWWKEGWRRQEDDARIVASKSASGALSTQAAPQGAH